MPLQAGQALHHLTEKALKTKEGQALVTGGATLLMAAAPIVAPAVAVGAVTLGIGMAVHYAAHKLWHCFQS